MNEWLTNTYPIWKKRKILSIRYGNKTLSDSLYQCTEYSVHTGYPKNRLIRIFINDWMIISKTVCILKLQPVYFNKTAYKKKHLIFDIHNSWSRNFNLDSNLKNMKFMDYRVQNMAKKQHFLHLSYGTK